MKRKNPPRNARLKSRQLLEDIARELTTAPSNLDSLQPKTLGEKPLMNLLADYLKGEEIQEHLNERLAAIRDPDDREIAAAFYRTYQNMDHLDLSHLPHGRSVLVDFAREMDERRIFPIMQEYLHLLATNVTKYGEKADATEILEAKYGLYARIDSAKAVLQNMRLLNQKQAASIGEPGMTVAELTTGFLDRLQNVESITEAAMGKFRMLGSLLPEELGHGIRRGPLRIT